MVGFEAHAAFGYAQDCGIGQNDKRLDRLAERNLPAARVRYATGDAAGWIH